MNNVDRIGTAVMALLGVLSRFDVHLAPGEDGSALIEGSKDAFTLLMGDLRLVFEEKIATRSEQTL